MSEEKPQGYEQKGWGYEIVWSNNENYCGKILVFTAVNAKTSMVFHKTKDKTWFVNAGRFVARWVDTETATTNERLLVEGDVFKIAPLVPHQLEALLPESMIFEVSTADSKEDYFRIAPGDTQTKNRV